MVIAKRSTTAAAIHDVLERAGSLGDEPQRPPVSTRIRREVRRCLMRQSHATRRRGAVVVLAAAAVVVPVVVEDARAEDFRPAWASWYGPGLWGNPLGCTGEPLQRGTIGVAHKTKPCGQRLRLCARRCATARVIDRGPFVAGREFDLTQALKDAVGLRIGPRGAGRIFVRAQ